MFRISYSKYIPGLFVALALVVVTLTAMTSCSKQDSGNEYLFEYCGTIEPSQVGENGFYIGFAAYRNGSCLLYTAMITADRTLLEYEQKKCMIRYGSEGVTLYEKDSEIIIATGTFTGEMLMSELLLTWDSPVCGTWEKYADRYGWKPPCRMLMKAHNIDDIRY